MATQAETIEKIEREANDLLKEAHFSAIGMRKKLRKQGYDRKDITKALRNIDWVKQAKLVAQEEYQYSETTPDMLTSLLAGYGFTGQERQKAMESLDWSDRGKDVARTILEDQEVGSQALIDEMKILGFRPAQTESIVTSLQVDWNDRLNNVVATMLETGSSRKNILTTLRETGYDSLEIRRVLRSKKVDWNRQAVMFATDDALWCTDSRIVAADMEEEGFTVSQIEHAMSMVEFGSLTLAELAVADYMHEWGQSEDDLRELLADCGYSWKVADAALKKADIAHIDWVDAAAAPIQEFLEKNDMLSRSSTRAELSERGYSREQITNALKSVKLNWKERAHNYAVEQELNEGILARRAMREALQDGGFRKDEIEFALKKHYGKADDTQWAYRQACFMGIGFLSKAQIRQNLIDGGISQEIADDIVDRLYFDWKEHAYRTAEIVVQGTMQQGQVPFPFTILAFLSKEGFTNQDQKGVIEKLPVPWESIAAGVIEDELTSCCGLSWIETLLRMRKFSEQHIEKAKELVGTDEINWKEQALHSLARALERQIIEPDKLRMLMHDRGLTDEEIDYAFSHAVIPKNIDWNGNALAVAREIEAEMHFSPAELRSQLAEQYFSEDQMAYVMKNIHLDLKSEIQQRALMFLKMDVHPAVVPAVLEQIGFPAKQVRDVMGQFSFFDEF